MNAKPVQYITPDDLRAAPVWEFDLGHETDLERDETWVVPVNALPVHDLTNRILGTIVCLADGTQLAAMISNVHLQDPRRNREFVVLSLHDGAGWLHLARYFDVDRDRRGPEWLSAALRKTVHEVFPIRYDISSLAVGRADVVAGEIPAEPGERLSSEQRLALLLE